MNTILLGYMGSGKSTIGKELALQKSCQFIDLDEYMVEKEKDTIASIFKNKGEIYFRKIETQYLKEVLELNKDIILAVGGGTPCYGKNIEIINNFNSVYLKASINELYSRLKSRKSERPLIKNISDENLQEFIAKHLFERKYFYEKANKTIQVDGKNINEVIDAIKQDMQ